jgi:hypothetical protein
MFVRAAALLTSLKTVTPPFGELLTSLKISHMCVLVCAVRSGSSPIVVHRAGSAGTNEWMKSTTGEFQGATTPAGSRRVVV